MSDPKPLTPTEVILQLETSLIELQSALKLLKDQLAKYTWREELSWKVQLSAADPNESITLVNSCPGTDEGILSAVSIVQTYLQVTKQLRNLTDLLYDEQLAAALAAAPPAQPLAAMINNVYQKRRALETQLQLVDPGADKIEQEPGINPCTGPGDTLSACAELFDIRLETWLTNPKTPGDFKNRGPRLHALTSDLLLHRNQCLDADTVTLLLSSWDGTAELYVTDSQEPSVYGYPLTLASYFCLHEQLDDLYVQLSASAS